MQCTLSRHLCHYGFNTLLARAMHFEPAINGVAAKNSCSSVYSHWLKTREVDDSSYMVYGLNMYGEGTLCSLR